MAHSIACALCRCSLFLLLQYYRDYDRALNNYMGVDGIGMDLTLVSTHHPDCSFLSNTSKASHGQLRA